MYSIKAGDEASWKNYDPASGKAGGAQVFPGFQPTNEVNEGRNVMGAYVDVETDISKMLLVNGAARIENYSDFGTAFAGKLAARVKLADAFSIRGAISNGFRAPSMHQTWFNNTSTQFQQVGGALVPSNTLTVKNSDPIAAALGIDKLKAETSVNTSIGVTARIADFLSLTVDAYQINIKDRVLLAGLFRRTNATVKSILDAAGTDPQVSIAQAFANMVDTRTRGLDIVAAASPKIGTGTLDITLAANFNETAIQAIKGSSKLPVGVYNVNNIQFDRIEQSRLEIGTPKDKVALGLTYRNKGGLGGTVRLTRFGKVGVWSTTSIANTTPVQYTDEYYSAKTIADVSVNYTISKVARITVGANNLLDVYPDQLKWFVDGAGNKTNPFYGNTGEGRFVYSRNATQFGMSGRYIYAAVSVNF
jgi:iron complex outermembrane receptor protein